MFRLFKEDKPVIKFSTDEELLGLIPHPVPAKKAMPDWFRKLKPTAPGQSLAEGTTAKRCVPVLDAVSQGFIIPLWSDLLVNVSVSWDLYHKEALLSTIPEKQDAEGIIGKALDDKPGSLPVTKIVEGEVKVFIAAAAEGILDFEAIGGHSWDQVGNACDLKKFEFGKKLFKLNNPWTIETPPGWSVKFQKPANNWSNEIQLIEGVVDCDEYYSEVNFPFVWTGSKIGQFIIPKGTPIAHVIPFKRTDIDLDIGITDKERNKQISKLMATKWVDRYRTFYWSKRKT